MFVELGVLTGEEQGWLIADFMGGESKQLLTIVENSNDQKVVCPNKVLKKATIPVKEEIGYGI